VQHSKGFIRYQIRTDKKTNSEYGTFCHAERVDGVKKNNDKWLGRVIDKEKGIFFTKKNSYYKFSVIEGFIALKDDEKKVYLANDNSKISKRSHGNNKEIKKSKSISFGKIFIIYEYLKNIGLFDIFKKAYEKDTETLLSLIMFRLLNDKANLYAFNWWDKSYAKYIFPNAKLQSKKISEFIISLGSENNFREFFSNYFEYINKNTENSNILIDSTGLTNDIKIPMTLFNNYNGKLSNELRLIVVTDKTHGFPIYYRYVPGNIVDVCTLYLIINELKEYKVNIDKLILDAGYYSEDNIAELLKNNINFMTKMVPRKGLYHQLILEHVPNLKNEKNYVNFGCRHLYIKKTIIDLFKSKLPVYAFICLDVAKQHIAELEYLNNFYILENNNNDKKRFLIDELKQGVFILITTFDITKDEVLPTYYTRQSIEQIFDYLRNETTMLPIKDHSEEAFSGHLFISFMATIAFIALAKQLKQNNISIAVALDELSYLNGREYNNKIIPDIATKNVNNIAKCLNIKIPKKIKL
jgi:transposase